MNNLLIWRQREGFYLGLVDRWFNELVIPEEVVPRRIYSPSRSNWSLVLHALESDSEYFIFLLKSVCSMEKYIVTKVLTGIGTAIWGYDKRMYWQNAKATDSNMHILTHFKSRWLALKTIYPLICPLFPSLLSSLSILFLNPLLINQPISLYITWTQNNQRGSQPLAT